MYRFKIVYTQQQMPENAGHDFIKPRLVTRVSETIVSSDRSNIAAVLKKFKQDHRQYTVKSIEPLA